MLSAIGLGSVTPGAPFWIVGSPLFERARIRLGEQPGAGTFTITAPGASLLGKYVQSARIDGAPLTRAWLRDEVVRPGGTLELRMGITPNREWGASPTARPPSQADTPLGGFGCRTP